MAEVRLAAERGRTRITAKIAQSARIFSDMADETRKASAAKAVLPYLSCISHAHLGFCCHALDWPVKRLYGLMIDFCSDPSPTSCVSRGQTHGIRNELHIRLKCLHRPVQGSRFYPATGQTDFILTEREGPRKTVKSHFTDEVKLVAHRVGRTHELRNEVVEELISDLVGENRRELDVVNAVKSGCCPLWGETACFRTEGELRSENFPACRCIQANRKPPKGSWWRSRLSKGCSRFLKHERGLRLPTKKRKRPFFGVSFPTF
jgi:hypothetical protein